VGQRAPGGESNQGDAEIVAVGRQADARRDTIYAPSTAPGRSGIAVVRVSGPQAGPAIAALTGHEGPPARKAMLRRLAEADGRAIDQGLVLWFPAPHSFTGEDAAEFHVHGGRAIVEAVLAALKAVPGLRLAEPGEFTRRAVENGKLDLTAAEGLADLIAAETEAQRRQALRQYDGALAALYEGWRARLIEQAAWIEAAIDFSEEELPEGVLDRALAALRAIGREMEEHVDDGGRGEIVRDGLRIALIGPPNAGKSSLLNALAKRDVAIVSETPGTTRDVIEVRLDLGGYPVVLADTAGLRDAGDAIEEEGVRRALARARDAELVVLVLDGQLGDRPLLAGDVAAKLCLTIWNKTDLVRRDAGARELSVSAKTGEGLDALIVALTARVREITDVQNESPPLTRARHREALGEAIAALARAFDAPHPELVAEDVRLALRALGRITGRVDVEELLDVIFKDFCIGK
jgi:tRNA modification GTPase